MKKIIHKIKVYPKVEKLYEPFYQKRRVAIYARVSTSSDEQLNSIEAQRDYYLKYVEERSDLIFVKLYADEGITGTSQKMRVEFQKMMSDAKAGAFDLIITKSISRFARNTVDSLICIRLLKEYGIEVYFQKEDIGTFDSKGEFMITLLSSMAQEESRSISENV
ncbi:MAG: recombinase family protein, partial [Clostridia bacterium]|nr:recombinase family protein [Clostridia bacterium]